MNRYYIETYDNKYDWDYNVMADSEEQAVERLKEFWESEEMDEKTIHKISGPYEATHVMLAKGPNL